MNGTTSGDTLVIRPAQAGDVGRLLAFMRELAAEEGLAPALRADEASLLRDGFGDQPRFHALLAELDTVAVGYVSYTPGYSIWAAGSILLLDDLFVAPAWRGRGIGKQLLAAIRGLCKAKGHVHARWTVETGNHEAIGLYERMGARVATKGVCTWKTDDA